MIKREFLFFYFLDNNRIHGNNNRKKDLILEKLKKAATLKLPARAGIWSVISGLVSRGVGVVGTPIFTRLLTPEEYGIYPLYTTWLSILSSIMISTLAGSAIYRALQRYGKRREEFIAGATGLGLLLGGGTLMLALILRDKAVLLTGIPYRLILLMISETAAGSVLSLRSAIYKYEYKYKSLALINITTAILTPAIALFFVLFTPLRREARMLGSAISTVAVALPLFLRAQRGGRLYSREIWKYLIRVNAPLVPHYLSSGLILRISEIVIGRSHGEAALAKYSVGVSVGLALTFLTNALSQVISPWIIRKEREGKNEEIKSTLNLASGLLITATLLILAVAPEILDIMTPAEYGDALPTVYPLALSVTAMFISGAISAAEAYYEKSIRASLPTVITALVTVAVTSLLLPGLDYRISSLFTLGAYIILVLLSALTFKSISGKSIIDLDKCTLLLSLSILFASILFVLSDRLALRIILSLPLIPLLLFLLYKTYKRIKES